MGVEPVGAERGARAERDHAVRVVPDDVVFVGGQVRGFHEPLREIIDRVFPQRQAAEPRRPFPVDPPATRRRAVEEDVDEVGTRD